MTNGFSKEKINNSLNSLDSLDINLVLSASFDTFLVARTIVIKASSRQKGNKKPIGINLPRVLRGRQPQRLGFPRRLLDD